LPIGGLAASTLNNSDPSFDFMSDSPQRSRRPLKSHNRWLLLIAIYKLLYALLFAAIGIGALRLVHTDVSDLLSDLLATLADRLRFNPESSLVNFILEKAELVNDPLLRRIGLIAFGYSAVTLAEGIGLYLEQAWGEYLTLAITASFLPLEAYEIVCRITSVRIGLFVINLLVFFYLLRVVSDRARQRRARQSSL
jgi:uncharacterized membrane protein (DUF2068 family)